MPTNMRPFVVALDDESDNLEFVSRALRADFDVQAFSDPVEALRALRIQQAAVVISDQRMPKMTGVEFLTQVAQIAPVSVRMLVTAYADLGVAIDAVNRSRVSAILCKPLDAETLLKEVTRAARIHDSAVNLRARLDALARENQALTKTISELKEDESRRGR